MKTVHFSLSFFIMHQVQHLEPISRNNLSLRIIVMQHMRIKQFVILVFRKKIVKDFLSFPSLWEHQCFLFVQAGDESTLTGDKWRHIYLSLFCRLLTTHSSRVGESFSLRYQNLDNRNHQHQFSKISLMYRIPMTFPIWLHNFYGPNLPFHLIIK